MSPLDAAGMAIKQQAVDLHHPVNPLVIGRLQASGQRLALKDGVDTCASGSFSANAISTPIRRTRSPCCALAASGHAAAAPPSSVMNSRRLIGALPPGLGPHIITSLCKNAAVHHSKNCALMSQMGR
jgi:hypothetical protein